MKERVAAKAVPWHIFFVFRASGRLVPFSPKRIYIFFHTEEPSKGDNDSNSHPQRLKLRLGGAGAPSSL